KCCISGVGALKIDYKSRTMEVNGKVYNEGAWISLNGSTGNIFEGNLATVEPELSGEFGEIMELADKYSRMKVRTNADTPKDAKVARNFGAQGIGLTRTEHMFFEEDRIKAMREMIIAETEEGRKTALVKLLPMQRTDFEGIFEAMQGLPVTIRLLDPPLHEFVPHELEQQEELAKEMKISLETIKNKVAELEEFNPMLGHRGCRLGNTYPEITEMQTRAIIEAALNLKARGIVAVPEIMVPLIGTLSEFTAQEDIIRATASKVFEERNDTIDYLVGTMIEIPRAALTADLIAQRAEFFSFGTNDLTQMTFGYSRDDVGKFLPIYIKKGILAVDPFDVLDQEGVGQLVKMGTEKGRSIKPNLKVGICGEHGGEPSSIAFCHNTGLDYVSCSPYRVPIARVAAAQAAIISQD
ncbi:MAG: pyruvate, phosphate dikinase, partial [Flavobacteriaceae bacterium]|nr:pyruvate, phosphate dikinase [Flavobacteriaceae bacterium]